MTDNEQFKLMRLNTSLQKCRAHMSRLHYATSQVDPLFPPTSAVYEIVLRSHYW